MKFEIKNRWTTSVIFTAEINCHENTSHGIKLGLAVKSAFSTMADLSWADLWWADLSWANLSNANLSWADLSNANLSNANLSNADLSWADLSWADLSNADLSNANLSNANLSWANLWGANLSNANLSWAKNTKIAIARTMVCADGDIIGWKKCKDGVIVKLLIPADAKRSNATGRKCRAEFAKVMEIFGDSKAVSQYDAKFIYRVGETVKPTNPFCLEWNKECESGIHFFITREEAEAY